MVFAEGYLRRVDLPAAADLVAAVPLPAAGLGERLDRRGPAGAAAESSEACRPSTTRSSLALSPYVSIPMMPRGSQSVSSVPSTSPPLTLPSGAPSTWMSCFAMI